MDFLQKLKNNFKLDGLNQLVNKKTGAVINEISDSKSEYLSIRMGGRLTLLHRAKYCLYHNCVPDSIDHIDGNTRNNDIKNLRSCTLSENQMNKKTVNGVKGCFLQKSGKYRAIISYEYKKYSLGYHFTLESAQRAYDKKAAELCPRFCYLNIPENHPETAHGARVIAQELDRQMS